MDTEIANFTQEERRDYRESQKDFWDLFAVTETAEKISLINKKYSRNNHTGGHYVGCGL